MAGFERALNIGRVTARDRLRFARVDQLLHGIGARGIQQAIAPRCAIGLRRHQRLGHELLQRIDDAIGRGTLFRGDCDRPLEREGAGEDGESLKHCAFALADQAKLQSSVAPSVCCRGGAVRRPRHSSLSLESSSAAISRNP